MELEGISGEACAATRATNIGRGAAAGGTAKAMERTSAGACAAHTVQAWCSCLSL